MAALIESDLLVPYIPQYFRQPVFPLVSIILFQMTPPELLTSIQKLLIITARMEVLSTWT